MTLATLVVKLVGDIGPFVTAMDSAQKSARSGASGIAGALNGALGGIGNVAMLGAGAAVAGAAAIGTAALAAAMDLDEAYDTIITKTGATGDALDGLKADFDAVFTSIPTDAAAAGDVIAELNKRLGVTGPNLTNLAKPLLEMSRLTGGDASQNAALFSRVIGDWGLPLEDASAYLDELYVVSQKTGIGTDALMEKIVQFGSPMRLMGFSFDESAALMGKWEKEGVNTELVLGSLRIAAGKFAKDNVPLRDGLMKTIDSIKGMKDQSSALALGMKVFGAKAGPDMVAAIREGRFAIDDMISAMQNADGAIMQTAEATSDFPEKLQVMKNKAELILAPLGSLIMEGIGGALDALAPVLDRVLPLIRQGMEKLIAWIRDTWPKIQPVVERVFGIIGKVVEGFSKLVAGDMSGFGESIGAAFNSAIEMVKPVWDQFWGTTLPAAWEAFKPAFAAAWTEFWGTTVPAAWEAFKVIFMQLWDQFWGTAVPAAWESFKMIFQMAWDGFWGTTVPAAWTAFTQLFQALWDGFWGTSVPAAWESFKMIFQMAWDGFWGTTVPAAWESFKMLFQMAWDQFWGTTVPAAWQNFVAIITGAWNTFWGTTLPGAWNNFKNALTAAWNQFWGTTLPGLWTIFKNKVTGEWNTFWGTTIPKAWDNFVAAITLTWNQFWGTTIPQAINSAIDFIRGIPDKFVEFGRQLIQGLVNGIKNAGASIKQALEDVVNGAVNWFKNLLGIESPSTVMAGFGEMMMRGLQQGIRRNMDLPRLAFEEATADFSIETRAATSPAMSRVAAIGAAGQGGNTSYSSSQAWNVTTDENGLRLLLEQQRMRAIRGFEERM